MTVSTARDLSGRRGQLSDLAICSGSTIRAIAGPYYLSKSPARAVAAISGAARHPSEDWDASMAAGTAVRPRYGVSTADRSGMVTG